MLSAEKTPLSKKFRGQIKRFGSTKPKPPDSKVFQKTFGSFHIGSYQVCEKWLKDRKGRTLSKDDIIHYQKVGIHHLSETIRLMKEIDEVIEKHGDWPDAFVTNQNKEAVPVETKIIAPGLYGTPRPEQAEDSHCRLNPCKNRGKRRKKFRSIWG